MLQPLLCLHSACRSTMLRESRLTERGACAGLQPLENITPLLIQPKFVDSQPLHTQALNKVRSS